NNCLYNVQAHEGFQRAKGLYMNRKLLLAGLFWILNIQGGCSRNGGGGEPEPPPPPPPPPPPAVNEVDFWLTKGDQTALLQKQNTVLSFGSTANSNPTITVDSTQRFQSIDGFGYTLTGGSAELINGLSA